MPKRLPILIFVSLLITSCSTTRIDQEVNAAYSIEDGESIVVLSDSYHTGNKTENDFMDCLNRSLSKKQDSIMYQSPDGSKSLKLNLLLP